MRKQKGITLVALIITIVVLMILAGVAISSINENGILGYAENAATAWNQAQKNEAGIISGYEEYLENMGKDKCTHNWSNGTCTICKITCNHSGEKIYRREANYVGTAIEAANGGEHTRYEYCSTCNSETSRTTESCWFGSWPEYTGQCLGCGGQHS